MIPNIELSFWHFELIETATSLDYKVILSPLAYLNS